MNIIEKSQPTSLSLSIMESLSVIGGFTLSMSIGRTFFSSSDYLVLVGREDSNFYAIVWMLCGLLIFCHFLLMLQSELKVK